jgi:glutamate racemase
MISKENSIAVFDSGIGGISVLKELVQIMPNENFIYYGDSKNAPYGTKTVQEVCDLTNMNIREMMQHGIKAIVIACNTITSVAIQTLREEYRNIPVIGIEPALKPAVKYKENSNVLVMATPITIQEEKFHYLMEACNNQADITPLPCPGLADLIEKGKTSGPELENYLKDILLPYQSKRFDCIVLGCTHYPFIKDSIRRVLGYDVTFFDGGLGTAKETLRRLTECNLTTTRVGKGEVILHNSLNEDSMLQLWNMNHY